MFWNRRTHLTDEDLSAYLDAELAPPRAAGAEAHITACDACRDRLDGFRQGRLLVSRLPVQDAPRSFALTPAMAAGGPRPVPAPPKRSSLVFAPAAALTLLVALFAVDLASSGSFSSSDESASSSGGQQAMSAKDASSSAGVSAESARTADAFSAPAVAPPLPTTGEPSAAPSGLPPTTAPQGQSASPLAPVPPPSTGGGAGSGPVPTVVPPATGPGIQPTPGAAGPRTVPVPSTGNSGITSEAQPVPDGGDRDEGPLSSTGVAIEDDGGADWLRLGQIIAAVVFVVSSIVVFGPGLLRKGSS